MSLPFYSSIEIAVEDNKLALANEIRTYKKIYQKSQELNVLNANDVSLEVFDARIRGGERVVGQSVGDNHVA